METKKIRGAHRRRGSPHQFRLWLRTPHPFELSLALHGHGWINLPPMSWDREKSVFRTAIRLAEGPVDLQVRQSGRRLLVEGAAFRPLGRKGREDIRRILGHMLRMDGHLDLFWSLCRRHKGFEWVARRGGGRLLRSPTLFEDLMKLLFTTNCSWAATRSMTRNLCEALGGTTPRSLPCFPTAESCARRDETFFRTRVRAGYRSPFCLELARAFAEGRLSGARLEDPALTTEELRGELLRIPGFGPYAAGQALRLLGRYEDLALDSWCRGKLARILEKKKPPGDSWIERRYRPFRPFQGLALWMELTADWHAGESRLI